MGVIDKTKIRKKAHKFFVCLFVVSMFITTGCNGDKNMNKDEPMETREPFIEDVNALGLYVDGEGTIKLCGNAFYGYGVNSFSLVTHELDVGGESHYREQIDLLKSYNIPFIRINFGGYWPEYYERFDENPDALIEKMGAVVSYAEEKEMGLICSLLWYDGAISYHVGEKRSAMGDETSKTCKYTEEYVSKIVSTFVNSPAIWGWEIGNEYNLGADLCDPELKNYLPNGPATPETPSGLDYYTSEELAKYVTFVSKIIRKYDKTRLISSGNGEMRSASQALHDAALKMDENHMWTMDWTGDTVESFENMISLYTPDPCDTVCFHLQHATKDKNGKDIFQKTLDRFGETLLNKEYFESYVEACKKLKKACYFGEFGDLMAMEDDPKAASFYNSLVSDIKTSGIQLASSWQFTVSNWVATDEGIDGEKLMILRDVNLSFQEEGKQKIKEYWEKYSK